MSCILNLCDPPHGYTVTQVSITKLLDCSGPKLSLSNQKYDIKILFFFSGEILAVRQKHTYRNYTALLLFSAVHDKHTPWAQEPVALPDMGIFVLQMSVWPDEGLRGEHNPVLGLLELLEQLFGTRGENHIIAKSWREWKQKTLVQCGSGLCEASDTIKTDEGVAIIWYQPELICLWLCLLPEKEL